MRDNISSEREIEEFADKWVTSFFGSTARASITRSKSARLAIQCGYHATAIVPDLQLTRDAARRVCASFAPAHRILIPLRPLTGHSQLVSLSLPSCISVYPAFFHPRPRSYPAPSFWLTVYLLFQRYQSVPSSPLLSLSPSYSRPRTHTRTSFSFMQPSIVVVVF